MTHHFQKGDDRMSIGGMKQVLKIRRQSGLFSEEALQPLIAEISLREAEAEAVNVRYVQQQEQEKEKVVS